MTAQSRTPTLRAALAAAASTLALAACSTSEPEPAPSPAPSASATPSSSPTTAATTAPTLPPEADGTGKEAAEAFAQHWVLTLNTSAAKLNGDPLRELSADSCGACQGIAEAMSDIGSSGGFSEGGDWTITRLAGSVKVGRVWDVGMRIRSSPQRYKESADSPTQTSSGNEFGVVLSLSRDEASWQAVNLTFLD